MENIPIECDRCEKEAKRYKEALNKRRTRRQRRNDIENAEALGIKLATQKLRP